jgi:hypothetical protein
LLNAKFEGIKLQKPVKDLHSIDPLELRIDDIFHMDEIPLFPKKSKDGID